MSAILRVWPDRNFLLDGSIEMSESMSAEWEKWLTQERSNVEHIESRLATLSLSVENHGAPRYREFWIDANEISNMLNTLTPFPEEDKERLSAQHKRICREVKKRQDEEWQARRAQSKQMRASIEEKIQNACACADSAPDDADNLTKAQASLSETLALLKNNGECDPPPSDTAGASSSYSGLLQEDRGYCWEKWKEANDAVFARRQAIWDRNYEVINPDARAACEEANSGDPFQALEKVKETQGRLKDVQLSRTQREEVRNTLNSAWETAITKANTIREKKRKRHEEWLVRMEGNVAQWTDMLRRNKETALEMTDQVRKLSGEIRNAISKEHADMLRDWIAEKRQKIKEINEMNTELEEKIASAKEKLVNKIPQRHEE